jgi:hypothetical protein
VFRANLRARSGAVASQGLLQKRGVSYGLQPPSFERVVIIACTLLSFRAGKDRAAVRQVALFYRLLTVPWQPRRLAAGSSGEASSDLPVELNSVPSCRSMSASADAMASSMSLTP